MFSGDFFRFCVVEYEVYIWRIYCVVCFDLNLFLISIFEVYIFFEIIVLQMFKMSYESY